MPWAQVFFKQVVKGFAELSIVHGNNGNYPIKLAKSRKEYSTKPKILRIFSPKL